MTHRLHRDVAWVLDENGTTIYTMRMPHGVPIALQGVASLLFEDLAAGLDPVAEARRRWPEGGEEVTRASEDFLRQLVEAGVAVELDRPRRARTDDDLPLTAAPAPQAAGGPAAAMVADGAPAAGGAASAARDLATDPYRVLWVCTANICRSAYADVVTRTLQVPGLHSQSAGTHALIGHEIDPPMARQLPAQARPGQHRAQQLTRTLMEESDLVIAMSERHRAFILEEWPALARKTFLIGHAAREIGRLPADVTLDQLAAHLWHHRTADPGDSIRDPYGRGEDAAAECAQRIDYHLRVILDGIRTLTRA